MPYTLRRYVTAHNFTTTTREENTNEQRKEGQTERNLGGKETEEKEKR
jgi:hypothetical protein